MDTNTNSNMSNTKAVEPLTFQKNKRQRLFLFVMAFALIGLALILSTQAAPKEVTIDVRAQGSTGSEKIELRIKDALVAEWDLKKSQRTFTYRHSSSVDDKDVRIAFINDRYTPQEDRNVKIDYIRVNDDMFETENSLVYSVGTWRRSDGCSGGNKQSEWLHCNGYLQYNIGDVGQIKDEPPVEDESPTKTNITIQSRGMIGSERMELHIRDQVVGSWTMSTLFSSYEYATDEAIGDKDIKVVFVNDSYVNGTDLNLEVDFIEINSVRYETEAAGVYSEGSSGCSPGYKQSQVLYCNGYFLYETSNDGVIEGPVIPPIIEPAPPSASGDTYFVDCIAGNDGNDGRSTNSSWRTLERANSATLNAGDTLSLKRGCVFSEQQLILSSSGNADQPVLINGYGQGAEPVIRNSSDNGGTVRFIGSYNVVDGIHLEGVATKWVSSSASACVGTPTNYVLGFAFDPGANSNTLRNSRATGFYAGVFIKSNANNNTVTKNVFTKNNIMSPNDSTNGNNDAGAFGILIWGDSNDISYNEITDHDACSIDYGRDGGAVEIFKGKDNIVHHNASHNNDVFAELGDSRSSGNVFAYNQVSSTIKGSIFLVTRGANDTFGPVQDTAVYNNSVRLTGSDSQGVVCYAGCSSAILTLKNNIIWAEQKVLYADGVFSEGSNIYWSSNGYPTVQNNGSSSVAQSSKIANPRFRSQDTGDYGIASDSPAVAAAEALDIVRNFKVDLADVSIAAPVAIDSGAYQQ